MQCVSFSPYFLSGIFIIAVNVLKITFEMCAETYAGANAQCPSLLSDFNQN